MIEIILTAILRKAIFAALIAVVFLCWDKGYFRAFDTDKVIANDPQAIAILYAGLFISLAFA